VKTGWVKLWRKSLDIGWLTNHELWTFWCWCLMSAAFKETSELVGLKRVRLSPGQLIFKRREVASLLKVSESKIFRMLNFLKSEQMVSVQTNNRFSIITIVNWDTYQDDTPGSEQQNGTISEQQTNNKRTTNEQQADPTTSKKKLRNKERKSKPKKTFAPPSELEVVRFFQENGYSVAVAKKAFNHYALADWHDTNGKPVRNWKQKMNTVWFRDENKTKSDIPQQPSLQEALK